MVLPEGIREGDLRVVNGKIQDIDATLSNYAEEIVQGKGLHLIPGVIDPHVHFREPGFTHKESIATGSRAAAAGGVTSFFEMPNTSPATTTYDTMAEKKRIASETSLVNYNFFIGATHDNLEVLNTVENVPGIKVFVGSSTGDLLVNEPKLLNDIFANGTRLIAVHSEDDDIIAQNKEVYGHMTDPEVHMKIRNPQAALACTKMLVELAEKHHRRLHICHLSTQEEADFLKDKLGGLITTEVSPQHLLLQGPEVYRQHGTLAKINPPIREARHRHALFQALKEGRIQCVATDHAPHTLEEKNRPYAKAPSGMPMIELSLSLMLDQVHKGTVSLEEVVKWMCAGPASVYGIPLKGCLSIGYHGDLTLVDLDAKRTVTREKLVSKAGWNVFEGQTLTGIPIATYVNGQMVYREGDFFDAIKGQEVRF